MSHNFLSTLILFFFFFPMLGHGIQSDNCTPIKCRKDGPTIHFPFRLKNRQQDRNCGYPGFDLFCDENNQTVLELPLSIKFSVEKIDYASQKLHLYDNVETCLPQKLPYLNLSASPFSFRQKWLNDYELLNCSVSLQYYSAIRCLSVPGFQVLPVSPSEDVSDSFFYDSLASCTKIHEIRAVPWNLILRNDDVRDLWMSWSEPECGRCEARGRLCSLVELEDDVGVESGPHKIQCIENPNRNKGQSRRRFLIAGAITGSFISVAILASLCYIYHSIIKDRENQAKIEKFLQDYKALKPARFSYADLKRITNQFSEKLGEGGYGTVYKGKLSNEIFVAVKVLNNSKGNGEEFINEVGTIGRIHHVNVVRLVGFCADGFRRALVYEFLPNDSLEKFIFQTDPCKKNSLGLEKLHDIALGISKGIEYLHQGCDQQILHFDIKPHNILLDHKFVPKISDFGLAKLCGKEQSAVSMTAARGTMGYIAPKVLSRTFGRVSYKSDVYSFGMMLLEMVGGRKNVDETMKSSQVYFPQWIYNNLINQQGEEILIQIEGGDECKIVKKLTIVGLWCIQWYPADRPSMKSVVQMLKGDGESLDMPPNPFPSTNTTHSIGGMPKRYHQTELPIISEVE